VKRKMTSELQRRTLRDVFYDGLRNFWDACGPPTLRPITKISNQLDELYGEQYRNLPALPRQTLSDLINRKREGFPAAGLLSSFILSCQRYAFENGVIDHDPGPASLPGWHERLQSFTKRGADAPATPADINDDGASRTSQEQASPHPDPAPLTSAEEPVPAAHRCQRTLTQQRFYDLFGSYGLELLAAAEDQHDPNAAYRIALLLYLERCPREALAWLTKATGTDHFGASRLNEADDPIEAAAAHVYTLGSFAFAARDYEVAQFYYQRAARNRHVEAAFELGVLLMEAGEPTQATYWFNVAAEGGHEYARTRFNDIHRVLLGEAFTAPSSDETGGMTALTLEDLHRAVEDPEATPPYGMSTFT
jgi:tetratricopeptide (TPR) repeat protein